MLSLRHFDLDRDAWCGEMNRISGYGPINYFSFLRSCFYFGLAWWSHALGQMFTVSLLAILVFWHFSILVSYVAEDIQKCKHDHNYKHIKQSSAFSVVRELSSIQLSSFSPIFFPTAVHAYHRVLFSSLPVATPCLYSTS